LICLMLVLKGIIVLPLDAPRQQMPSAPAKPALRREDSVKMNHK
jgi:hypothetical protein